MSGQQLQGAASGQVERPNFSLAFSVIVAATLFCSAFLLFAVEPMISRMVLPRLGGSPAVWTTCMCFFQAALLAGYAYADLLTLRLALRAQVGLHAVVLLAALALMPISIGQGVPDAGASPGLWLLAHLCLGIGLPFAALAATAPLLQKWFSLTDHARAKDPYFLYSASNFGSLAALLLYPSAIEALLGLSAQIRIWCIAFGVLVTAVIASGVLAALRPAALAAEAIASRASLPPGWRTQLRWVGLACVPSGLMLAVTTYITTDVASAPLLWLIPLALYMLTFIVAFGRAQRALPRFLPQLQIIMLAVAGVAALTGPPTLLALGIALLVFTVTALTCHCELARGRPETSHLTRYFLLISVGGAVGGILNALVAPMLFRGPWEYPLLLITACAMAPAAQGVRAPSAAPGPADARLPLLRPVLLLVAGAALLYASSPLAPAGLRPYGQAAGLALPAAALIWIGGRAMRSGAGLRLQMTVGLACLLILPLIVRESSAELSARSFFGTYHVTRLPGEQVTVLQHGTTLHGVQGDAPGEATVPMGYYAPEGPFGHLFKVLHARTSRLANVAVLGLGTGVLGCYARPGEAWSFREIDPLVEHIARDDRYFHFMKLCGNNAPVIIGDARITLAREGATKYDVIVSDVFSSDSVPVHLLTREALSLYLSHLAPGGVIAFHLSNRYLALVPVVARLAADAGAPARHKLTLPRTPSKHFTGAEVVVVGAPGSNLDDFTRDGWDVPQPGPVLWTDDRSDIVRAIRW